MLYLWPFLAVMGGFGLASIWQPQSRKQLKLLLAFSGSFLLSMTVIHLLPELFAQGQPHLGLWIMLGIVTQIVLEYFSKGAEHGHFHLHKGELDAALPWGLFISLSLHALLEGLPLRQYPDLVYSLSIHHFPIAVFLTLFWLQAGGNKHTIAFYMAIFALMTPLGTFLAQWPVWANYQAQMTAWVVGIIFHISSTIIFESSEGHKFNLAKISAILLGLGLAACL